MEAGSTDLGTSSGRDDVTDSDAGRMLNFQSPKDGRALALLERTLSTEQSTPILCLERLSVIKTALSKVVMFIIETN